jgi:hypothetical protein
MAGNETNQKLCADTVSGQTFICMFTCWSGEILLPVCSAYQPPADITFLSEQTSHQQPASSTFLSEQTSTSH